MDEETRRLLAEFVDVAKGLRGTLPPAPPSGLARFVDLRLNLATVLTVVVLVGGAYVQLQRVELNTEQNKTNIERVEADHKDLERAFSRHAQRRHAAAVSGGGSTSSAEPIVIRRPTPGELRAMMAAHGSER